MGFCKVLGYVVFFGTLAVLTLTFFFSFSYGNDARCLGDAFHNPKSPTFRSGSGKCEERFTLQTSLRKKPVMSWYYSYQGDFLDGHKNGSGQYIAWSLFNNYNFAPYEGKDKVQFSGMWLDDKRNGYGIFSMPLVKYRGDWANDSLTCENGWLEARRSKDEVAEDSSLPKMLVGGITYTGSVAKSLPDGQGVMEFKSQLAMKDGFPSVKATFKDGVIQSVEEMLIGGVKVKVLSFQDKCSNGKHTVEAAVELNGKKYHWDGAELKASEGSSITNSNREGQDKGAVELFDVLYGTSFLQDALFANQDHVEHYPFRDFAHIKKKQGDTKQEL